MDSELSADDSFEVRRPHAAVNPSRLTITLQTAETLNMQFQNGGGSAEHSSDESDCTDVSDNPETSPKTGSACSRLKAMNAEQIKELLHMTENLQMSKGKSSCSEDEDEENEHNDMVVDSGKEESPRAEVKNNQKKVTKEIKNKRVPKPKNKEEALPTGVNEDSDEQEVTNKKVTKPKRGKKGEAEGEKENARSAPKTKGSRNKTTKEEVEVEDKKPTKGKSNAKKAEKVVEKIEELEEEENEVKSKPVNSKPKGRGKPIDSDSHEKVQEAAAKKATKAPTTKKDSKEIKKTEKSPSVEKENKPLKKTKAAVLKESNENKETKPNIKPDCANEEISVARKRATRKINTEPVETDLISDQSNEEQTKKKVGKPKGAEKSKSADELKKNEKPNKNVKANDVEKPIESKNAKTTETKSRAKKAAEVAVTEEVMPKRSTRSRKV